MAIPGRGAATRLTLKPPAAQTRTTQGQRGKTPADSRFRYSEPIRRLGNAAGLDHGDDPIAIIQAQDKRWFDLDHVVMGPVGAEEHAFGLGRHHEGLGVASGDLAITHCRHPFRACRCTR